MKQDEAPFDAMLEQRSTQQQSALATTAPYVVGTLKLAWAGARQVFGDAARPEHALMLLPFMISAAEAERLELQSVTEHRRSDATTPRAVHGRARLNQT